MTMIRQHNNVPAKRGMEVIYNGRVARGGSPAKGVITGSTGHCLRIRLAGEAHSGYYHPTWEIVYPGMTR